MSSAPVGETSAQYPEYKLGQTWEQRGVSVTCVGHIDEVPVFDDLVTSLAEFEGIPVSAARTLTCRFSTRQDMLIGTYIHGTILTLSDKVPLPVKPHTTNPFYPEQNLGPLRIGDRLFSYELKMGTMGSAASLALIPQSSQLRSVEHVIIFPNLNFDPDATTCKLGWASEFPGVPTERTIPDFSIGGRAEDGQYLGAIIRAGKGQHIVGLQVPFDIHKYNHLRYDGSLTIPFRLISTPIDTGLE